MRRRDGMVTSGLESRGEDGMWFVRGQRRRRRNRQRAGDVEGIGLRVRLPDADEEGEETRRVYKNFIGGGQSDVKG